MCYAEPPVPLLPPLCSPPQGYIVTTLEGTPPVVRTQSRAARPHSRPSPSPRLSLCTSHPLLLPYRHSKPTAPLFPPFFLPSPSLPSPRPQIPLLHRFWTWRTPFSDEVWGTLAASLIVIGWFMWFFERCDNEDDFGHHVHTPVYEQIWNGVYLAFAGFTSKTEEFSPKTLPGRFLGMIHAFAIFLTVSFYIANLATVFISAPAPDQPIKGIKSFSQLDLPACLGNKTAFTDFMTQAHPEIPLRIVSPSVTGVLDALIEDDPPCLGGVMTDVLFQCARHTPLFPAVHSFRRSPFAALRRGGLCSVTTSAPALPAATVAALLRSRPTW